MALAGYYIAFKLGITSGSTTTYKTFAGRTQDDLTIAARTRERLTKDDAGATQVAVIGQDVTFRATGLVELTSSTAITRDQLIGFALQAGTNAVFSFQYATNGNDLLSGSCVITNLSESSNASDDATLTVDFRVVGAPTFDDDTTS